MNEITKNVDAYVFGAEPDSVAGVVATAIGSPFSCERMGDFRFYSIAGSQLVTNPSEGGYFCYSLVDCDLWESDVEFARFLASATGRSVRCDPGSVCPEVSPYSDTFLQIENGNESLVDWYADGEESAQPCGQLDCLSPSAKIVATNALASAKDKHSPMEDFQQQWKEARERMAEGVEAVLCFDLGVVGQQLAGYTSFILDEVVLCEFEKVLGCELPKSWCVMTLVSHTKTVLASGLTKDEAVAQLKQLCEENRYGKHWMQREF